jgi:hypothetical protein
MHRRHLEDVNAGLIEEVSQQQELISELRSQLSSTHARLEELQDRIHKVIGDTVAERVRSPSIVNGTRTKLATGSSVGQLTFRVSLQMKENRADMQQEVKERLASVAAVVSKKLAGFKSLLNMLRTDVHTQLQHVHADQANTIKRTLYRLETVRFTDTLQ